RRLRGRARTGGAVRAMLGVRPVGPPARRRGGGAGGGRAAGGGGRASPPGRTGPGPDRGGVAGGRRAGGRAVEATEGAGRLRADVHRDGTARWRVRVATGPAGGRAAGR